MNITYFDTEKNTVEKTVQKDILVTQKTINRIFLVGVFIFFFLLSFYVGMLNYLANRGYDLELLRHEHLVHQKAMETIDINLAIPSSLYALESNEFVQEMPSVKYRHFINLLDEQFVKKELEKA